jgi:hypothetical protein
VFTYLTLPHGDSPARDFIHGVHDKVFEWPERMAEIRQKAARSLIKVNGIMLFAFGGNKKLNAPIPLKEGAPIGERATAGGKKLSQVERASPLSAPRLPARFAQSGKWPAITPAAFVQHRSDERVWGSCDWT